MASYSCSRKLDDDSPCFMSNAPHFFKIVLAHTVREGKLEIPKKFVRKYGKALLNNQVRLKVPSGAEWNVELTKGDGNVWFQNGWQEFVEFYSVRLGYFLVFRYEGNSCFHVVIFDHSASEIQYPVKKTHQDEVKEVMFDGQRDLPMPKSSENNFEFHKDDGRYVQIFDNITWSKETRDRKTQITPCSLPNKKMKPTRKTVCNSRKIVEPSMPEGFSTKELKVEKMLENEDLHCPHEESKDNSGIPKTEKSNLWRVKIESKDFEVGQSSSALKTVKSEHCWRKQPLTATQQARVIDKATTFKSLIANPSFMVTMRPSYIYTGKTLCIPRSFVDMHLKEATEIVVQVSDGRVWNIRCVVRWNQNKKKAELRGGWLRFARDNNLRQGDVCVFEMMDSAKRSFKVTIFRVLESETNHLSSL